MSQRFPPSSGAPVPTQNSQQARYQQPMPPQPGNPNMRPYASGPGQNFPVGVLHWFVFIFFVNEMIKNNFVQKIAAARFYASTANRSWRWSDASAATSTRYAGKWIPKCWQHEGQSANAKHSKWKAPARVPSSIGCQSAKKVRKYLPVTSRPCLIYYFVHSLQFGISGEEKKETS